MPTWDCNNGVCFDPGTGNGAYSSLTACQAVCIATEITDVSINEQLTVFPNPTKDIITIKFKVTTLQDIDITIVNSLGKNVFTSTVTNYIGTLNKKVNLSSFSTGLYFIKITTNKGESITERIGHIK
tara:strand:- start:832 stop:1212 length:381 start_codon:yes stop_codon:yes gene_type:complete